MFVEDDTGGEVYEQEEVDLTDEDVHSGQVSDSENGLLLVEQTDFSNLEDDFLVDDIECPVNSDDESDEDWDSDNGKDREKSVYISENPVGFSLSQTFKDVDQFREVVTEFSVSTHRPVRFDRSNIDRVYARCVERDCPWRIWCSFEKRLGKFQIKALDDKHTCSMSAKNRLCNSTWLGKKFLEKFRSNSSYRARDLQVDCLQNFGITISRSQCYRARTAALRKLHGNQAEHFEKLRRYEAELKKSNRGSTIFIQTDNSEPEKPIFQRMYVGFDPLRKGWLECCRPIIGLDGAFLKWFVKGELLSAVGRDANNQMFSIASAIVEVENTESFNSSIRSARAKPIISLLEDIRRSTMQRIALRLTKISKWEGSITSKAQEQIDINIAKSVYAEILSNGRQKWEVCLEDERCVVDMECKTCSCRLWLLSGIPCYHAIAVILRRNGKVTDYVSPFYTKLFWEKVYQNVLYPLNGEKLWPHSDEPNIQPPRSRKMPGRPKRNRVRDPFESPKKKGKLTRHGRIFTCSHCGVNGHNKTGCAQRKSGLPAMPNAAKRRPGRPLLSSQGSTSMVGEQQMRRRGPNVTPSAWNRPSQASQESSGRRDV